MAGFSEFDVFRSQQIREGLIDRNTALKKISDENKFDIEVLVEFFSQIGMSSSDVMDQISRFPKTYDLSC